MKRQKWSPLTSKFLFFDFFALDIFLIDMKLNVDVCRLIL